MAGNARRAGGRIVVGVDGTATSAAAVRWAIREARLRQASLHLVSADGSRQGARAPYAGGPGPPRPDAGNPLETALHAAEQQATQTLPAARLSSELADGSPAWVLIDRSAGAELLVLGSAYQEGQSAIQAPPVIGPVARACLHQAACPVVFVLAVRPQENSLAPLIFISGEQRPRHGSPAYRINPPVARPHRPHGMKARYRTSRPRYRSYQCSARPLGMPAGGGVK